MAVYGCGVFAGQLINDVYTALADAVEAAWEAVPATDPEREHRR
ncbi:hypothetical protein [Streptomyces sp. NBC_00582]|nr:hypothetical protein [Streptomyces sp. NBC_00582]WUB59447.1 hypothetical protein OG852_03050 [Streptomyces sp. NBC_00582]